MPRTPIVKPYRWLAQYYDELFSSFRFPIDAARERLLSRIIPSVDTACDLACGTGTTALILARKGITMYAVDLSPVMCRLAREKAERAGLPIRVLRADMRSFRLPKAVDLITCEYDALNHVPTRRTCGRLPGLWRGPFGPEATSSSMSTIRLDSSVIGRAPSGSRNRA